MKNPFRSRNYLGETRKDENTRRIEAVEQHVMDLEERFQEDKRTHLAEFHHGQTGRVKVGNTYVKWGPEGDPE